MKIKIVGKGKSIFAKLKNSETASKIYTSLPFRTKANLWGEEIYFEIPVKCKAKNTCTIVKKYDVAYWPEGNCLCIFFGKTPISKKEIRAYSPVEVIGKVIEGIENLQKIKRGDEIFVEKENEKS